MREKEKGIPERAFRRESFLKQEASLVVGIRRRRVLKEEGSGIISIGFSIFFMFVLFV